MYIFGIQGNIKIAKRINIDVKTLGFHFLILPLHHLTDP